VIQELRKEDWQTKTKLYWKNYTKNL